MLRISIFLSALLCLNGCATNQMTGRSQFMLVSEKAAIAQSTQAYSSMMSSLDKDGKVSLDEPLNNRIRGITDKLITQAVRYRPEVKDWSWSVKVIDDPKVVNAFCMPGGKMAMYTGLIEKIQPTDDEVSQVMGHEIAHALASHGAEKMSVQLASNIAVAAIAASGRTRQSQQSRYDAASLAALAIINLPNSRQAESEADKLGIELAARAGYDPRAAVTLWQKLMRASGSSSKFDFLSTHPASEKRIEALAALEEPMMKIYQESKTDNHSVRSWTSLAPNVRAVEVGGKPNEQEKPAENQPLVFYSPEFEKFQAGTLELTCKSECATPFLLKQGTFKELYNAKNWRGLAMETIKVGYRFDLSYYYLGAAAQGLNFGEASRKYFDEAVKLSETKDYSCANAIFLKCGDIDVVKASTQSLSSN